MKKVFLNFILLLSSALCLTACSDDEVPVPKRLHATGSRSLIADGFEVSTSNPMLLKNWETVQYIYIPNEFQKIENITPPWKSGSDNSLPADFSTDIKKEDGWTMLFHTFKDAATDPEIRYMVFYNLFTGVIKVFYFYREHDDATNSQWVFKCTDKIGQDPCKFKMFYVPTFLSKADNDVSITKDTGVTLSNSVDLKNSALKRGWNGFKYKVAQYSKEDLNKMFLITAQSDVSINTKFEGFLMNDISGKIKSVTVPETMGKNNASEMINSVAEMGGDAARDYINGLFDESKDTSSDKEKKFSGELSGFLQGLAGTVADEGVTALLKKGLGILFGQTSTVTVQKTVSDVSLTAEGSVTLKGESNIPTASGASSITFNLGEILNGISSSSTNPNLVYSASSNSANNKLSNLGVWCVKNKPVVYFDLVKPFYLEESTDLESYDPLEVSGTTSLPTVKYGNIDIVFNPAVQQYITSYTVDRKYFLATLKGKEYYSQYFSANPGSSNIVYSGDARTIYNEPAWGSSGRCSFLCDIVSNEVNSNSQFYMQWKKPTNSEMLVLVTVTMNINYMGKERTITESRVFEVDSREQLSTIQHNPPRTVILNHDNTGWMYWNNLLSNRKPAEKPIKLKLDNK